MNLKQFDLNLLVIFYSVYQHNSVSKAAEELCISQSALSHALARLRQKLDDALFIRINNCMTPTQRAIELAAQMERALPIIEQAVYSPSTFDAKTANRTFTLVATDYTEYCLLPKLVRHLAEVAPHISLRVLPANNINVSAMLEDNAIDFALGFEHQTFQSSTIAYSTWLTDSYATLVSREHSEISDMLTLERFLQASHILIAPWGERRGIVDQVLAKQGLSRKIAVQLPSVLVAPHVLANSNYLLTLPQQIAEQVSRNSQCQIFIPPIEIPKYQLNIYWHKLNNDKPEIKWLVGVVRELFNGQSLKK
ncbi:LysR family transcriptional regulator [Thalassotalea fusca]